MALTTINGTFSDQRTNIWWSAYHLKIPFTIMSSIGVKANENCKIDGLYFHNQSEDLKQLK